MPLPVKRSDFEQDRRFHAAVHDLLRAKAQRLSGEEWDLDAWEQCLQPVEFDVLLLSHFIGVWENNGRFVDTVRVWEDHFDLVDRAFRRLGFNVASVLMPRSLELDELQKPYWRDEMPLPADLEAEIDRFGIILQREKTRGRKLGGEEN